ncbi:uncharacterized protein LOC131330504 [Rhododendron vialii]|uniref:uncharacterized protein LOC131330504 n=1 Tax=Rhododendron vialii TaxID=182163 RepID=UPI002660328F|nr:uncharacterized protein LOC131330504 [Rhododendron vialii]
MRFYDNYAHTDGALDKARKDKKRQLKDTLNLVLKKRKHVQIGTLANQKLAEEELLEYKEDGFFACEKDSIIIPTCFSFDWNLYDPPRWSPWSINSCYGVVWGIICWSRLVAGWMCSFIGHFLYVYFNVVALDVPLNQWKHLLSPDKICI